jgi:pyridoxal 5'-phosphate synthase pdxT subunit
MTNSNKILKIGVLAFHGDVSEHMEATKKAGENLLIKLAVFPVRTKSELKNLDALILAGGESPTLQKLCERAGMWEEMTKIKNIFGTCAGAILLAKKVSNKSEKQKTLGLMDIEIDRNAYGRQADSFEKEITTTLGKIDAIFIRAPKIKSASKSIKILTEDSGEILACEQKQGNRFYLATCFHPELSTTKFHEYFIQHLI